MSKVKLGIYGATLDKRLLALMYGSGYNFVSVMKDRPDVAYFFDYAPEMSETRGLWDWTGMRSDQAYLTDPAVMEFALVEFVTVEIDTLL